MINLSLNKLNLIAKSRNIKGYKNRSKEYLTRILSKSKPKISQFKKKMKKIDKDFIELNHGLSKSKINEFIKSLYNMKIQKNVFALKKSLYNLKKYYDDTKYKRIRDTGNVFGKVYEDYYKPIKTKSAFNGNYTEYESKGVN